MHRRSSVASPDDIPHDADNMRRLLQQVLIEFRELRARIDSRNARDVGRHSRDSQSPPQQSNA